MNIQGSEQSGTQKNGEDGAVSNSSESFVGINEGQVDESCIDESPQQKGKKLPPSNISNDNSEEDIMRPRHL